MTYLESDLVMYILGTGSRLARVLRRTETMI
jgi:hypothetical protein